MRTISGLMARLEAEAVARGRTLLFLDTSVGASGAAALYERIVTLPLYPAMTRRMLERVAGMVEEVVRLHRRS